LRGPGMTPPFFTVGRSLFEGARVTCTHPGPYRAPFTPFSGILRIVIPDCRSVIRFRVRFSQFSRRRTGVRK
jgi:hypothetical protein